jgi:molybdate transport system regulatory protein
LKRIGELKINSKLKAECRIWLTNSSGKYVLGKGGFSLLQAIKEEKNLGVAAQKIGISYRKAWNIIKKIEEDLGESLVIAHKGGSGGGGGMELAESADGILNQYRNLELDVKKILSNFNLEK